MGAAIMKRFVFVVCLLLAMSLQGCNFTAYIVDKIEDNMDSKIDKPAIQVDKPTTPGNGQTEQNIRPDPMSQMTTGQQNALRAAHAYLRVSPFSFGGLVQQLEYEGYSTNDAVFAAQNCGADWCEQALASARHYLAMSPFSYGGLIDQLIYEGYTAEEATYGADYCGANWYDQAALQARAYLDIMPFSRDELIDQLQYEGFTEDQAIYGAQQVGY